MAFAILQNGEMKWPSRQRLWTIFSLGWLLFFLAMVCTCASNSSMMRAKALQAFAACKDVCLSILNFEVETGSFPSSISGKLKEDLTTDTSNSLVRCLLGEAVWGNSKRISYIDPIVARNGRNGLEITSDSYRLVDPWGLPFRVVMDSNGDGEVANPDTKNSELTIRQYAPSTLPKKVIVFSAGRDGIWFSSDDVTTWRGPGRSEERLADQLLEPQLLLCLGGLLLIIYGTIGLIATHERTR